ncbi:hypothetical protein [Hydrocarboniphaga sp.]|uniref:hypothetical protein n=1 Tax=Hydrocarboniphaga sp. TaxID=2033016 RepID=UPI002AB82757|nr:hypothetical protein [Hydrocarboniphaga sp.]MDZ4081086.1 hypothetical protein [Hydrocarboniphaga sp.]
MPAPLRCQTIANIPVHKMQCLASIMRVTSVAAAPWVTGPGTQMISGSRLKGASAMNLRYLDPVTNEPRFKRRFIWAFWGFVAGMAVGILAVEVLF